jgi:hypothetical protein
MYLLCEHGILLGPRIPKLVTLQGLSERGKSTHMQTRNTRAMLVVVACSAIH